MLDGNCVNASNKLNESIRQSQRMFYDACRQAACRIVAMAALFENC